MKLKYRPNPVTRIRLEQVCDMMRSLKFQRGVTYRALAVEWGISHDRAKKICAQASDIVLAEVTDPDKAKPEICSLLAEAMRKAFAESEYQALASLGRVYADVLGFARNTQATVKVVPGERTPAEARQIISQLFGSGAMPAEKKEEPS